MPQPSYDPVLVLNADYLPFKIVNWKKAIVWILEGKARMVESSGKVVHSPSIEVPAPSVIVLSYYVKRRVNKVPFNRMNILARDNYTCQYCEDKLRSLGGSLKLSDLTLEHVLPRAQGGATSWENIATSCYRCNQKKGNRTPEQAGMLLLQEPYEPYFMNPLEMRLRGKNVPDAWKPYCLWK